MARYKDYSYDQGKMIEAASQQELKRVIVRQQAAQLFRVFAIVHFGPNHLLSNFLDIIRILRTGQEKI